MDALVFICPEAGRPFSTGINMDEYTLESTRQVILRVRCPCCGKDRELSVKDARLLPAA